MDKSGNPHRAFLFRCDCGKECVKQLAPVRAGAIKTCGCKIGIKNKKRTHGMSNTRFYRCWAEMLGRCNTPTKTDYPHYGGRGIKVCERWHKFENFYVDMYQEYLDHSKRHTEKNTTIDRINSNGNYKSSNCRWATRAIQTRNSNRNIYITYNGKTQTVAEWARESGVRKITIARRLRQGRTLEEIFASENLKKKMVTYEGKTQCISDWEKELGFNEGTIKHRLARGLSVEEAFKDVNYGMKMITHNGETLCVADWARKVGMNQAKLRARIDLGIPFAEAIKKGNRAKKMITYNGKTQSISEWEAELGLKNKIGYRLRQGWPLEKVFSTEEFKSGFASESYRARANP